MRDYAERRQFPRVKSNFGATIFPSLESGDIRVGCLSRDIGRGGIRVVMPREAIVGKETIVQFNLPESENIFSIVGEVVWCFPSSVKRGFFESGIKFTDINTFEKDSISDYVSRNISTATYA